MAPPEVELDRVTTVLDDTPVLHRLRLTLAPGEITVLMGSSGAGKTTLVRHLTGLVPPDRGTIRIGERDVGSAGEDELRQIRRGMSVMLGGSSLFDVSIFASLTVLDNLTYSLDAHGMRADELRERAMAQLGELNLTDVAARKPDTLPAHARKRLALARALVVHAPLVVLDEVDLGLDAAHRGVILAALHNNHARTGCTMLVTTHSIDLARALGGSLAILSNGRIAAHGSAADLLHGVGSSEEFDLRFRISDFMGPPRVDDAASAPDESGRAIDQRVIWVGLIGLVLVALLAAISGLAGLPGTG